MAYPPKVIQAALTNSGKPISQMSKKPKHYGKPMPRDYSSNIQLENYMRQLLTRNALNDYPVVGPVQQNIINAQAHQMAAPPRRDIDWFNRAKEINQMVEYMNNRGA